MTNLVDDREAFERWASAQGHQVGKWMGNYLIPVTERAWEAWQAALAHAQQWKPIESAPSLDRIMVAGWQPSRGNTAGYWWVHEDATDDKGVPIDHPTATLWQPLPTAPDAKDGGQ